MRAASLFPPTAYIPIPNLVHFAIYTHRRTRIKNMGMRIEMPDLTPRNPLKNLIFAKRRISFSIGTELWAIMDTMPLKANIMAREAIHEDILIFVTIKPIIKPDITPTINPAAIPKTGFFCPTTPMTTPLRANTEPTERSISPNRITNVMPMAKKPPFFAAFSRIFTILTDDRKFLSANTMLDIIIRTKNARIVLFE